MLTCLRLLMSMQDDEGIWDMPEADNGASDDVDEELDFGWDDVSTGEPGLVGDGMDFSCLSAQTQTFTRSIPSEASVQQQQPFTGTVAALPWSDRWPVIMLFRKLGISRATFRADIFEIIENAAAAGLGEGVAGGEGEEGQVEAGLKVWGNAKEADRFLLIRECLHYMGQPGLMDEEQQHILFG